MRAHLRIVIVALVSLILGGVGGYIAGARSVGSYFSKEVHQLCLGESAKEAAVYSQLLRSLREGDEVFAIDRLETLLDYAVIHFSESYAPEYDMGHAGHAFHCALDYRTVYPHRPSSDWAAQRYSAALALKTRDN